MRLEQLYPFPRAELEALLRRYPDARELRWVQEEPANMGAWRSTRHRLEAILPPGTRLRLVARHASPTPATGNYHVHAEQERVLLERALAPFGPGRRAAAPDAGEGGVVVSVEVQVPRLAESVADATLVEWLKGDGEAVRVDEPIAVLETDKAAVEIAATETGALRHARRVGDVVRAGDVLGRIEPGTVAAAPASAPAPAPAPTPAPAPGPRCDAARPGRAPPARGARPRPGRAGRHRPGRAHPQGGRPAAPRGRPGRAGACRRRRPPRPAPPPGERLVPMSRIRLRIAERLVRAQHDGRDPHHLQRGGHGRDRWSCARASAGASSRSTACGSA